MTNQALVLPRQSKYCIAIEAALAGMGHATNNQLLDVLRLQFPEVSATTVHRATARLADRGQIGVAPAALDGAMRYDNITVPHDHFMCNLCGVLRDTDVKDSITTILEESIDGCNISGRLTISGVCKNCNQENIV